MPATVYGMFEGEGEEVIMTSVYEAAEDVSQAEEPAEDLDFPCELGEPMWSVATFEAVAASGLSYDEAQELAKKLDTERVSGICIITDRAARRIVN